MAPRSRKENDVSRFLDVEAAVEECDEESDEEGFDAFVVSDTEEIEGDHDNPPLQRSVDEPEEMADDDDGDDGPSSERSLLDELYRCVFQTKDIIIPDPHQVAADAVLLPTVHDPDLWMIRTKPGSEFAVICNILMNHRDGLVISASLLPNCPGRVYVEGRNPSQLWRAFSQISDVSVSKGITLIPVNERAELFDIRTEDRRIIMGDWVRLRRGPYKGDLAHVIHSSPNSDRIRIAVIPRICLSEPIPLQNKKRKRKTERYPARLFDPLKIKHIYGPTSVKQQRFSHIFDNKIYYNGMLLLHLQAAHTALRVPSPRLAEIKPFIDADFVTPAYALEVASDAIVVRPGDQVELIAGAQSGCKAMVVNSHDDIALVDLESSNSNDKRASTSSVFLEVPLKHIRPVFRVGDNVRIREGMGEHAGSSGCVIAVLDDGKRLNFVEDKTRNIIDTLSISVERFQPDKVHANPTHEVQLSVKYFSNPLIGRRILVVGKTTFKGYVGYVRNIALNTAFIEMEANHRVERISAHDVIDFTTGRTLAGTDIPLEWRQDFTNALRNYVVGRKTCSITPPYTPPPSIPQSLSSSQLEVENQTSPWCVNAEDLRDLRTPYDGPGKWLLDSRIREKFDADTLVLKFKTNYERGRWSDRTAKIQKSWFILEPPGPEEVALTWTDNRAVACSANVHVQCLAPARPILGERALIIEGPNIGETGTVKRRKKGGKSLVKLVKVELDNSNVLVEMPESALCRIDD